MLGVSFMCFFIMVCTYKLTTFRIHKKNIVYDNELSYSSVYVNEIAL
jgi:hypothetical protein